LTTFKEDALHSLSYSLILIVSDELDLIACPQSYKKNATMAE
jgi:hypothetical protein